MENKTFSELFLDKLMDLETSILGVCFVLDQYAKDEKIQLALLNSYVGIRQLLERYNDDITVSRN